MLDRSSNRRKKEEGRRKKEEGRRKKEEGSSATSNVRDVTDVSPSEEGSSATSNVRDVTDVSPSEEGRRKGGRRKREQIPLSPPLCVPLSL
ncbi:MULTISPECIES: hypothetical protein [unclassified Tychonema]|uniref:hypothetical protein n=1 Tax=unclassified Tychonema TaxID=2642144 RepID=UPI0018806717|nr:MULTISPECIES: hypothetical protein [unclassified Tychonema]MBE9133649.1 hypothetical protein [Tychonema sp. LEGE 07196]